MTDDLSNKPQDDDEGECLDCDCDLTGQIDLHKLMGDHTTMDGVTTFTVGTMICANIGDQLRALLKQADPDGYQKYRQLKYPDGPNSLTNASAQAAMRFVFERTAQLLLPHYVSSAVFRKQTQES